VVASGSAAPAYSIELEREWLGSAFLRLDCAQAVVDGPSDILYAPIHQHVHEAMRQLVTRGMVPTPALVVDELCPQGGDEEERVVSHVLACHDAIMASTPEMTRYTQQRLQQYATRRWLREECMRTLTLIDQPDPEALVLETIQRLMTHRTMRSGCTVRSIGDLVAHVYEHLDDEPTGITWGFPRLDAVFGPNGQDWLTFIGGRPSSGKTALALNMAHAVARTGRPTLFASLEMSDEAAATRILSGVAGVSAKDIRERKVSELQRAVGQIAAACNDLRDVPMYIMTPRASIADIRREAIRLQAEVGQPLGGLYIDRIELLKEVKEAPISESRTATTKAALALQDLAKELQIPVICLVQMSRDIEKRGAHRPRMSDARESGTIEEVAMVMMLFEQLDPDNMPPPGHQQTRKIHVVKNMHGTTGWAPLRFIPWATTFTDMTDAEYEAEVKMAERMRRT
jgi:replicative DNA helicase